MKHNPSKHSNQNWAHPLLNPQQPRNYLQHPAQCLGFFSSTFEVCDQCQQA